jgi:hypothetical protein
MRVVLFKADIPFLLMLSFMYRTRLICILRQKVRMLVLATAEERTIGIQKE